MYKAKLTLHKIKELFDFIDYVPVILIHFTHSCDVKHRTWWKRTTLYTT